MPATQLMIIFLASGKWSNWDPEQSVKLKTSFLPVTPAILSHRTKNHERYILPLHKLTLQYRRERQNSSSSNLINSFQLF